MKSPIPNIVEALKSIFTLVAIQIVEAVDSDGGEKDVWGGEEIARREKKSMRRPK